MEVTDQPKQGLRLMYFVLKPIKTDPHGLAARKAILTYAQEIKTHNLELAQDLEAWIKELYDKDAEARKI